MYVLYNRFTALEYGRYDDWSIAHAEQLLLNSDRTDMDPCALRLNF